MSCLKTGTRVRISGDSADLWIQEYNVRVDSLGTVVETPGPRARKVMVTIDSIDGESKVTAFVRRSRCIPVDAAPMPMIIGLTIHDNDFQDLLYKFAQNLAAGRLILGNKPELVAADLHAWVRWHDAVDKARLAVLKNGNPTEEQKQTVIKAIQESWKEFIKNHQAEAYLSSALEATLHNTINASWQNGEQFYIFPTSYQDTVLCF